MSLSKEIVSSEMKPQQDTIKKRTKTGQLVKERDPLNRNGSSSSSSSNIVGPGTDYAPHTQPSVAEIPTPNLINDRYNYLRHMRSARSHKHSTHIKEVFKTEDPNGDADPDETGMSVKAPDFFDLDYRTAEKSKEATDCFFHRSKAIMSCIANDSSYDKTIKPTRKGATRSEFMANQSAKINPAQKQNETYDSVHPGSKGAGITVRDGAPRRHRSTRRGTRLAARGNRSQIMDPGLFTPPGATSNDDSKPK